MTTKTYTLSLKRAKSSTQQSFTTINVGGLDRLLRAILGSVLIADGIYVADPTLDLFGVVLILLSIPLITSAIMAWDPIYAILKIRTATLRANDAHYEKTREHNANGGINNVGTIDRILRIALASVLLATPALLVGPVGYAAVAGTMAGIVVMMTAVLGWDPFYQLAKIRTVTLSMTPSIIMRSPIDTLTLIDDVEGDHEDIFQKAA